MMKLERMVIMNTIKLTLAQAIVKFLDNQYISYDQKVSKFVDGFFTIFGHGNAVGLAEALDRKDHHLKVYQGRNEQGMCHAAIGFAKQLNRQKIIACTSSVGPGAANMITAAATATVNNIPLLLFPADTFASRRPDPVLQQIECSYDLTISTNDAFKAVCKFWDRINRPEQIMTSLINAMRVLTDSCETGAVCICLPQDVEAESYDYPIDFFKPRIHYIDRLIPSLESINQASSLLLQAKKPLIIVGGGVKYSEAGEVLVDFCQEFKIPFAETQSGKSACKSSSSLCLGGIGVTGTLMANQIAKDADLIIGVGTRLTDFTTASKSQFAQSKIININVSRFHSYKLDGLSVVGDAKVSLEQLKQILKANNYQSFYRDEIINAQKNYNEIVLKLANYNYDQDFKAIISDYDLRTIAEFNQKTLSVLTQTKAILTIRKHIEADAIIITAGGSLPSCLQRLWTTDAINSYHAEYGYSCMGYECSAILGVKLARKDKPVYTLVGDGSFQMLHSEMATIIQENLKVVIIVFDNCGYGCINNLQMSNGISSLATEFRKRDANQQLLGELIMTDYAKIAEGYGFESYQAKNEAELIDALNKAKKTQKAVLIDVKVLPKTMTDGFETFWDIGLASISDKQKVQAKYQELVNKRKLCRQY